MKLFSIVITLLTGFVGVFLGFRAFKNFTYITKEEVKLRFLIMTSIIAGASGFLAFFSIIMIMGILDSSYIWSTNKFLGAIFISLIIGVIITLGSFVQGVLITGFRKKLLNVLKRNDENN